MGGTNLVPPPNTVGVSGVPPIALGALFWGGAWDCWCLCLLKKKGGAQTWTPARAPTLSPQPHPGGGASTPPSTQDIYTAWMGGANWGYRGQGECWGVLCPPQGWGEGRGAASPEMEGKWGRARKKKEFCGFIKRRKKKKTKIKYETGGGDPQNPPLVTLSSDPGPWRWGGVIPSPHTHSHTHRGTAPPPQSIPPPQRVPVRGCGSQVDARSQCGF